MYAPAAILISNRVLMALTSNITYLYTKWMLKLGVKTDWCGSVFVKNRNLDREYFERKTNQTGLWVGGISVVPILTISWLILDRWQWSEVSSERGETESRSERGDWNNQMGLLCRDQKKNYKLIKSLYRLKQRPK